MDLPLKSPNLKASNKMKNIRYHTVGTVPKSNRKSQKEETSTPLTHKYMTTHFLGLVQALQLKVAVLK